MTSPATGPLRLDRPPARTAAIALPDEFGTRYAIFADAEEEFDWSRPFRREATATSAIAALPEANARFRAVGIRPTYLADWPVVTNPASAAVLRGLFEGGACDIGAQLHPWVNPPFEEKVNARNSFVANLPFALQCVKLSRLTHAITRAVGTAPIVHRAGRYGVGEHSARLLEAMGYRLDVSVRAGFSYKHECGPDFSRHPITPFRLSTRLHALPLTTSFTGLLGHSPVWQRTESFRGLMARAGLVNRIPLTPEGVPLEQAVEAIRQLHGDGHRLFSLSFHTPSLVPGHTPYVRDASDLKRFWKWWDGVIATFASLGISPVNSATIVDTLEAA